MSSEVGNASGTPRRSARTRRWMRRQLQDGGGNSTTSAPVAGASTNASIPKTHDSESMDEDIDEDDLCPICQLLLHRPVVTRCNHALCESCMAHWADVSVTSQMTIVDVDEEPAEFNPVSGVEARCPMCRTPTSARLDAARSEQLARKYPTTWRERETEERADGNGHSGEGTIQTLTVYVGNRHQLTDSDNANVHEWTFFVKPSRTDIIEEIQILLHPTFKPSRVIRQRPPYQIKRLGWGVFAIQAYVILKAGYSWVSDDAEDSPDGAPKGMLPLEWTLDFAGFGGKGSMGRCRLKVKNDRDWEDVSEEGEQDDVEHQRLVRQYERDGMFQPPEDN